ncbi:type II toxin-antitoxin system RelE/ParE family toxin [Pseudomonas sp. R2.Fl]|nr:type II toxin-antitoxin system RelE/ParE family toxin [Pseudomonas sp. R2.Fl]
MVWTIEFRESARKELTRLAAQDAERIVSYLENRLAKHDNPRQLGIALKGHELGGFWRYRVGEYRIIRDIHDLVVLVIEVGHRREVYRRR